jgi:uncharacterized protein with gpF-like domain
MKFGQFLKEMAEEEDMGIEDVESGEEMSQESSSENLKKISETSQRLTARIMKPHKFTLNYGDLAKQLKDVTGTTVNRAKAQRIANTILSAMGL